jgi:hypothetical protein
MTVASKVAQRKEAHPELYCTAKRCLWFIGHGFLCPRHTRSIAPYVAQAQRIANTYNALAQAEARPDLED